ncbi:MAG: hypothetical protein H7263_06715, partial [Candidatus Sericytochromatia bacterium]|nr:hypothetical protein [Candidatus Sericytochromatia bacterium]
ISYSEKQPAVYTTVDNPGDIIITGNVIYKNRIFPYKNEIVSSGFDFSAYNGFKQYPANLTTPPLLPSGFITDTTGTIPQIPPPPNPLPIVDSLGLFASNDIKIPVNHYHQPNPMENHFVTALENSNTVAGCPCQDELNIQAQLIAGHKIYVTKMPVGTTSKNDRLIMFGSFYSFLPPDFSYFDGGDPTKPEEDGTGRLYLFDKTLSNMPLSGSPYFPSDNTYSPSSQPVTGVNLPRIVPGTWKSVQQ